MRILLTGGTGFIGKNLYEGLKNKYTFFVPTRKELDLLDGEKVKKYIKKHQIDIIIHSAIQGGENVFEDTLRMFLNLTSCLYYVKKMIHLGSGAEYGKTRDIVKIKESDFGSYIPADKYGLAKYICSQLARHEKKILTLRLFGIYGKYEDYRYKFISNAIVKNILKMPIKIKQNVVFDYLYIEDFIPIIDFFLCSPSRHSVYNITPIQSITLKEIILIINEISTYKSKILIENNSYNFQYTGSNKRLCEEHNCQFTSYKKGIEDLFRYYLAQSSSLDIIAIKKDRYLQQVKIKLSRKKLIQ